ncbi:MAG TPA: hypothetical protein VHP80_17990 [Candidatus Acidoferrum sp.]|jgi:hypothetical protein|nr:hypothetical protein [Candidatus Acidoferrum sp.]
MSAPTRALANDPVMSARSMSSDVPYDSYGRNHTEAAASGVSWPAVFAGAFAAAALSLILLALGAGAGLSSLSPFSGAGVSTTAIGFGALIYLCITEIISSGVGGYLAGRLRTKWVDLHTDEVYFRDTAHGFLAWCVALVMSAAFLGAAAAGMVGASASSMNARAASNAGAADTVALEANRYYIDSLFRGSKVGNAAEETAYKAEAAGVFAHTLANRAVLMPDDRNYVAGLVSAATGLNHNEAEARVTNVFERDQAATDQARKSAAHALYWLFVALLLGAFTASFAATMGGHRRDHLPVMRAA